MFWKKITLDGYLPFTHVGNHHVEVEFDQPATAILGQNGCGKSSMLRMLRINDLPIRTEFLAGGKVEKIVEHQGHLFVLSADFKNSTAPHSFKRDGIELNLSGTSDTQKDLIEEHLGVSGMIDDIMSGNVRICAMQKSMRKILFSSMYPSDLSFVLEYHKKVCSQIRAFSNQIKLLQGREGSLVASLIGEAERCYMDDYREGYLEILNRIDKVNFILENEVKSLQMHEILHQENPSISLDEIKQKILESVRIFRSKLIDRKIGHKFSETPTIQNIHEMVVANSSCCKFYREKYAKNVEELESIRDELNKFIRVRDAPTSDKKDELESELHVLESQMEELKKSPNWQNIPSVHQDKIENIDQIISDVTKLVSILHSCEGKLLNQEGIDTLRNKCDTLTFSLANLMSEKNTLEQQLAQHRSRKEMMTQNSYPKDCTRVCGLRATLEASVRDIDLQCRELEARLDKIHSDVETTDAQLSGYKQQMVMISPYLPTMRNLWEKLSENYLLDLALDGESFVDCLNNHCTEIPNRIIKGAESSKIYYRYKDLFDRSEQIKNTLVMMKTNESVNLSLGMIKELIESRQQKLDDGIRDLDQLDRTIKSLETDVTNFTEAENALKMIEECIQTAQVILNRKIILNRIEFDQKMIQEHLVIKNEIGSRLREIEHTLEEQKRISDVLNTEIRPTLDDLRKQKLDWELVESGLSPTKGLPCIYLVRFMNRLISRANAIIKEIWYADMELSYVEEKDTLDYSIGVIFNKSTTVKDCSLCSNGQQAVINFAFTVALAIERGFMNWMPLICDEIDAALTEQHRAALVEVINRLIEEETIKQMFIVNHFAAQTGLSMCDTVCLSSEGVALPIGDYNKHTVIS